MTVTVDGAPRYVWPVSTGKPGYDTPSGTFRPNRMDADHLSQEWDNAPMPHTIFFDLHGHAIHGFLDTRHIGSRGLARLRAAGAAKRHHPVQPGRSPGHEGHDGHCQRPDAGRIESGNGAARCRGAAGRRRAADGDRARQSRSRTPINSGALRPTAAADILRTTAVRRAAAGSTSAADPGFLASRRSHPLTAKPQQYYVRSSNGQLYYVQPGYQQQYARPYSQY